MSEFRESGRTIPAPSGGWASSSALLAELTTEELRTLIDAGRAVALVPVGSTEPHGPHLPLATDVILSDEACLRAVRTLRERSTPAVVTPAVSYGVTRYARGFHGAIGVREETLIAFLADIARALLDDGFAHVAFVNNHLEPEHIEAIDRAVQEVADERGPTCISFPNQLSKRWGRTLTDEFKRGNCHAGQYETSLVLAAREELVRREVLIELPTLPISLSDAIKAHGGKDVTFREIGMERAYTGAPSTASREEGDATYQRLAEMIVTEVEERLAEDGDNTARGDIPKL